MKNVSLTLTGSGTIGEIQPGWNVSEEATPVAIGDFSGGVGSVGVSAGEGEDSEFVIDNLSTFTHPSMGKISGQVAALDSSGASEATDTTVSMQLTTPLSALAVERTATVISGAYDKISFAGYGTFPGVSNSDSHVVSHLNNDTSYIYTESGTMKITRVTPSGVASTVSTAIPTASPRVYGFIVDESDNYYVAVMVSGVPKVYKLNSSGGTVFSFGTLGSSTGQLAAFPGTMKSGIAVYGGNIYIADYGNNRIMYFSASTGSYVSNQVGASTVGLLAITTSMNRIYTVNSNNVLHRGVVSPFSFGMSMQLTGLSGYSITGLKYMGRNSEEIAILATKSGSALLGKVEDANFFTVGGAVPVDASLFTNIPTDVYAASMGISNQEAPPYAPFGPSFVTLLTSTNVTNYKTMRYITNGTTLRGLIAYYAALCGVNYIDYQASSDPSIIAISWTDNVWTKLKELFSAYGVEGYMIDDVLTIKDIGSKSLLAENIISGTARLKLDSRGTARAVNSTYYKTANTTPTGSSTIGSQTGLAYSAAISGKVFTVNTGSRVVETLITNAYLTKILQPVPGVDFFVQDANGVDVTTLWATASFGPKLSVEIGSVPNEIVVTLNGPDFELGVVPITGPYSIASNGLTRTPGLNIYGRGAFTEPTIVNIPTGADALKTPTEQAKDITNIFIDTIERLYDRTIWFSVGASGPQMTLTFDIPTSVIAKFGDAVGALVPFKESIYRITSTVIGAATTKVTAVHHVTTNDIDTKLSGKTTGQFDTFWLGNETEDFKIKPLRPVI